MQIHSTPKGKLIPIGGAEKRHETPKTAADMQALDNKLVVLQRVLEEAKGTATRLEVLTTASSIPEVVANEFLCSFQNLGCQSVGVMNIRTRKQALQKEYLSRLEQADALYFSGGNQMKITRAFLDTAFGEIMKKRYYEESDFVIAGTSAGAMMMSSAMIYEGTSKEAMTSGKAKITKGMELLPQSIIDTHFVNRNRLGRLMVGVVEYNDHIGIGLAEDTGVIITAGNYLECIGSGQVSLVDGRELVKEMQNEHNPKPHLHFERMIHHIMTAGQKYDVRGGVFY
ncbi:MAG: cyanophycinase [Bacteroidia bacterium]